MFYYPKVWQVRRKQLPPPVEVPKLRAMFSRLVSRCPDMMEEASFKAWQSNLGATVSQIFQSATGGPLHILVVGCQVQKRSAIKGSAGRAAHTLHEP